MDGSLIGLPERLRIWRTAGVRFFFKPCPAPDQHRSEPECVSFSAPEHLPDPWPRYWEKISKTPRFVFTYYELGKDLAGFGDSARSKLWKDLLFALKWPQGTVSFWPFTAYINNTLEIQMEYFSYGLNLLSPERIFYFGNADESDYQTVLQSFQEFSIEPVTLNSTSNIILNIHHAKRRVFDALQSYY